MILMMNNEVQAMMKKENLVQLLIQYLKWNEPYRHKYKLYRHVKNLIRRSFTQINKLNPLCKIKLLSTKNKLSNMNFSFVKTDTRELIKPDKNNGRIVVQIWFPKTLNKITRHVHNTHKCMIWLTENFLIWEGKCFKQIHF